MHVALQRGALAEKRLRQTLELADLASQIERLDSHGLLATHRDQRPRQRGGMIGGQADLLDAVALRIARRHARQRKRGVAVDGHQDVVEVVRHAAREAADELHLLDLAQLVLEALARVHLRPKPPRELTHVGEARFLRLEKDEEVAARIVRREVLHRQTEFRELADPREPWTADEEKPIAAVVALHRDELSAQPKLRPRHHGQHEDRAVVLANRVEAPDASRAIDRDVIRHGCAADDLGRDRLEARTDRGQPKFAIEREVKREQPPDERLVRVTWERAAVGIRHAAELPPADPWLVLAFHRMWNTSCARPASTRSDLISRSRSKRSPSPRRSPTTRGARPGLPE